MPKNLDLIASDAPEDVKIASIGIAPQRCLDLESQTTQCRAAYRFGRPPTIPVRPKQPPPSSPLQRVEHTAQSCSVEIAINTNTAANAKLD